MKNKKVDNIELVKVENLLEITKDITIEDETFKKLMFIYSTAIKEIKTKMEIIQDEFKIFYNYDLIDHIDTRIKEPDSIINKMNNKKFDITYKEMIDKINDVAGIRVICPIKKDIFTLRNLIVKIPGVNVIKEKDYVTHPKESGYSSYHLIVEVPISLSNSNIYVKVEVQIRTLAMDFWANLEHKMKYKAKEKVDKKTSKEWINYAKIINKLDNKIMLMNNL